MIAASEPWEFIPRGRQVVEEHPGPHAESKPLSNFPQENILLQRLQNVNISSPEEHKEFWCMRSVYDSFNDQEERHKKHFKNGTETNTKSSEQKINANYMSDFFVNSEEELYVKKYVAVWTRGLAVSRNELPRVSFTCETPIKFAMFCNKSFVHGTTQANAAVEAIDDEISVICLIDEKTLRVYCSDGEDFLTNLEFPVSQVWCTRFGLLLEKVALTSMLQHHNIPLPCLFALSHPLNEICPVLNKSATNVISYLTDSDYIIIFSADFTDLVLLYDKKIGKHYVSRLRKATESEINYISLQNDTAMSGTTHHFSTQRAGTVSSGVYNASQNSLKMSTNAAKNTSNLGRTSLGTNASYTNHVSKFLSSANSLNRNSVAFSLSQLHSSMAQNSFSMHDLRRLGQAQPSKPIVPQLCLEHLWTENTFGCSREFCEVSSRGFMHSDLVGQMFLCYLLPRCMKLQLVLINNYGTENVQFSTLPTTLLAKDAVPLERLHMIAVLDPCGSLCLYTGTVFVSKVHVNPSMSLRNSFLTPITQANVSNMNKISCNSTASFPRRSSLLPTAHKKSEANFDEELHMVSPVQPLQPQFCSRLNAACLGLRDPANNRLTLVYPNGKMFRLALPAFHDFICLERCIKSMSYLLNREHYLQLAIRFYVARNPPGSHDYTFVQEWQIFRNALLEMMGFTFVLHDSNMNNSSSFNAEEPKKRRKNDEEIAAGNEEDWQYMKSVLGRAGKPFINMSEDTQQEMSTSAVDTNACLFPMIPAIFYCLHLLYEDFKLDAAMHECLPYMAELLYQLAFDMHLSTYTFHYALDQPDLLERSKNCYQLTEQHAQSMKHQHLLGVAAPNIFAQLDNILRGCDCVEYEYIVGVNDLSRNVLQLCALIMHGDKYMRKWIRELKFPDTVQSHFEAKPKRAISARASRAEQVVEMLLRMEITRDDIERLPVAVHLIIAESLELVRLNPTMGCHPSYYELLLREELVEHAKMHRPKRRHTQNLHKIQQSNKIEDSMTARCKNSLTNSNSALQKVQDDGMLDIDTKLLSLRFPDDMRIAEVRRLLASSEPVLIDLTQSPGISDHEFIEEQEKQLFALCTRTMALPTGRGMFTLRTSIPKPTKIMPIPKLCLSGKEPTKGASIEMQQIEFPTNMSLWPNFHNGVAAGLKISPNACDVDSTWIVYNKPKGQTDIPTEHAGFLMALGLNGHLKSLSFTSIYEYLIRCDEMASVGLMLGISATHRGSMDNTTTKLLSVHIEALLPATALELDIPQNMQVAALMGIGLLYQGTAKRHIAEVLLQEVGRPPGPEMENSIERESYALTAGLALGLVTLGQGESPAGLLDLQLPDTLHYYMVGGNKRNLSGAQKEKYKLPSFKVREGDQMNLDVTAPGATLALGLMFFNTHNRAVAEWMEPPQSRYLLDLVRPDFLMLRTIAHGLIMWSDIQPTEDWLFDQFPANLRFDVDITLPPTTMECNDDDEAITQAYCNIIAGAAFCIGLKYAGSENPIAFKTLRRAIKTFLGFSGKYVGEYAGRTTIENCLMVIVLSLSLVFAGSGDIEIMRILRYLRSRVGPSHPFITFGSHMATNMALGFLFLGAGRFTVSQTPESVAALVCALFPKFPIHSNDNRYHLQAFRHLYVLAVEPRLFLPRDIDTKKMCLCNISVLEVGAQTLRRLPMAPCMLPELSTLQMLIVDDPNYWPVCFEKGRNWDQLLAALKNSSCIDIKKRLGCLSYQDDPDRLKSLLSQTLTREQFICWDIDPKILECFSNEPFIKSFTYHMLHPFTTDINEFESKRRQILTLLFYNAVVKDKMHVMPIYLDIFNMVLQSYQPKSLDTWQMKLLESYLCTYRQPHVLFSQELLQAQVEEFKLQLEQWRDVLTDNLYHILSTPVFDAKIFNKLYIEQKGQLIDVLIYYKLTPGMLTNFHTEYETDFFKLLQRFAGSIHETLTIYAIIKILQVYNLKYITV